MKLTKSLVILFLSLVPFKAIDAQSFTPFSTWNHAGISGVYLQPASIADTRLRFDMTFFGLDVNVGNSLYGLKSGFLKNWISDDDFDFDDYKVPLTGIKNHRALLSVDAQFLNFMVPLSPKSALGFTSRVRYMLNVDGIDPDLFNAIEDPLAFVGNNNKYTISDLSFRTNAWAEAGLTYAREIVDLDKHYLKAGVTLKLLQPVASAYMHIEEASYELYQDAPIGSIDPDDYVKFKAKGQIAFPGGFKDFENFTDPDVIFDDFKSGKRLGVGFDLGVVYEFRPDHEDYLKPEESTSKSRWNRYEPSKYKFRIGLSVLDIGSMKYNTDRLPDFAMTSFKELPKGDISDMDELEDAFGLQSKNTNYRVALPTAISLQTDWRITRVVYLGVNPYIALRQNVGNKVGTHYMSSLNITPRVEMAGLGVSLPVTYSQFKSLNVGIGMRLGPLWIGSNNAFSSLIFSKLREVNFCMAMRMSIYHKNKN